MHRRLLLAVLAATPLPTLGQTPEPSAADVLAMVRQSYALQDHRMTGRLRDGASGREEALELTLSESIMRFHFPGKPPETIQLDLTTTPATLWQAQSNGGQQRVPLASAASPVRGMDFNHEDLSQRFLYWKKVDMLDANARVTGGVRCWLVRVTAPDTKGPYYTVDLWVHKDSGGVARMDAYDSRSTLVKRFEVTKMWKVGDISSLREMRVQSFNPADGTRKGITYMTMDKPVKQ
jgi:hypothetical protein